MATRALPPFQLRRDAVRWGGSLVFAALLHIGVVCALDRRRDETNDESGTPVVLMELASVASAPPTRQSELPSGPEQDESEAQQASLTKQFEKRQDEPRQKDEIKRENPEADLPSLEKRPELDHLEAEQRPAATEAAEATTAPNAENVSDQVKGPPVGADSSNPSPAVVSWRKSMLSRLKRFHRYPATAHNASGVALVEFAIDRDGRLLTRRLVRSSGNRSLDLNSVELIQKAAPFPAPPPGASNAFLTISVPVRYDAKSK